MLADFFTWPFDFSCSGFIFILSIGFIWTSWSLASAAKKTANVVKKVAQSETAKHVGKTALEVWIDSWFRK